MARRARPLVVWIGTLAGALILTTLMVPLLAVIWRAEGFGGLRSRDWGTVWFTVWQAAVSAGLSVICAVPVARALSRRRFTGRGVVVLLLGAPFILPVIVAVLGLIAVFGRDGTVNTALVHFGFAPISLYGIHGVILAHVFFNMPLATRLILQGWATVPAERFRMAASLGFGPREILRHLEGPMLRTVVPGIFVVIFLICTTSFAVALALGGGPRSTTVELAIYQAFRFDFDLSRAATLAALQLMLGGAAALVTARLTLHADFSAGLDRVPQRWDGRGWALRLQDAGAILLACGFLLLPMTLVILDGAGAITSLPLSVWVAALRSLVMAIVAAGLTCALALAMALAAAQSRLSPALEAIAMLAISASPLVLGTGLYLLLLPITNPVAMALPITIGVNVMLALPFAFRALLPAARVLHGDYGRLSMSLGMGGLSWLRLIAMPRLRRPIGYAAGLTAALSAGDLGVIALFASPDQATLPLKLYQLMGAYKIEQAKAAAVILIALSLGLFWLFEKGTRRDADAG
jgi:thiamine transport system permease protein